MRVRALVIGVAVTVVALGGGAVAADFGTAIYAEYRLARTVRTEAKLGFDPWVGILGFPFIPQAMRHHYDEIELRAAAVERPIIGHATLEATFHSVDLADASWLVRPNAPLRVGKLEGRIIIDSVHLGRFMQITDLTVESPPKDTNDATGGTTESGISSNVGLIFTGTPKAAGFGKKVSVSVDLAMAGPGKTTLVVKATGITTRAGTAKQEVPDDKLRAVLDAFSTSLPDQRLPFGIAPTREGARGSDVIIEGITEGLTVRLAQFRCHDFVMGDRAVGDRRRSRGRCADRRAGTQTLGRAARQRWIKRHH